MNVIEKGREASMLSMILFFIMGIMGLVMNEPLLVRVGFIFAIISVPPTILMTFKLKGVEK